MDRSLGWSKGRSERYAGDINMSSGDLVGPRAILNDVLEI